MPGAGRRIRRRLGAFGSAHVSHRPGNGGRGQFACAEDRRPRVAATANARTQLLELTITGAADGLPRNGLSVAVKPWMPTMKPWHVARADVTAFKDGKYVLTDVDDFTDCSMMDSLRCAWTGDKFASPSRALLTLAIRERVVEAGRGWLGGTRLRYGMDRALRRSTGGPRTDLARSGARAHGSASERVESHLCVRHGAGEVRLSDVHTTRARAAAWPGGSPSDQGNVRRRQRDADDGSASALRIADGRGVRDRSRRISALGGCRRAAAGTHCRRTAHAPASRLIEVPIVGRRAARSGARRTSRRFRCAYARCAIGTSIGT
jgi:hypothetical protein